MFTQRAYVNCKEVSCVSNYARSCLRGEITVGHEGCLSYTDLSTVRIITTEEDILESLRHWDRMIRWVRRQQLDRKPLAKEMLSSLGEDWTHKWDPLCSEGCRFCLVDVVTGRRNCAGTPRFFVYMTRDWKEWLKLACEHVEFLNMLVLVMRELDREKGGEE